MSATAPDTLGEALGRRPGRFAARGWRLFFRGCFALALAVVAALLLLPSSDLPSIDLWDKFEHALTFALLTLTGSLAFPDRRQTWPLAAALVGFGAVCEILQTWVPGRTSSLADAAANTVGVLLATAVVALAQRRIRRR